MVTRTKRKVAVIMEGGRNEYLVTEGFRVKKLKLMNYALGRK